MEELGYRTNQHSVISDNIENEYMKEINVRVQESRNHLKVQKDEYQKLRTELDKCYSALNESMFQYKKSHNDQQNINQTVDVSDADGLDRMKRLMEMKKREFEKCKQQYALELEKTNTKEKVNHNMNLSCLKGP